MCSKALGCFAIFCGAFISSVVGVKTEQDFTLETTQDIIFRPAVLIYLLVVTAWVSFNIIFLIPRSKNPPGCPTSCSSLVSQSPLAARGSSRRECGSMRPFSWFPSMRELGLSPLQSQAL